MFWVVYGETEVASVPGLGSEDERESVALRAAAGCTDSVGRREYVLARRTSRRLGRGRIVGLAAGAGEAAREVDDALP